MKHVVLVGMLAGALAIGTVHLVPSAVAVQAAQQVEPPPEVPSGEIMLGTVRIPRAVLAGKQRLEPGTYQVRVTAEAAKPDAVGITEQYERWAEFLRGGQVVAREVLSIVPAAEIGRVAEDAPPRPGGVKVQMLKGNEYLRIWFNRTGTHYLIHLPPA